MGADERVQTIEQLGAALSKTINLQEKITSGELLLRKRLTLIYIALAAIVILCVAVLIYLVTLPLPTTEGDIMRYKNTQNILLIQQDKILKAQKVGDTQRNQMLQNQDDIKKRLDKIDKK